MDYLTAVNRLRDRAQWYYALTHNCTTALRGHMIPHVTTTQWSWKSLLNGKLDEHLHAIGAVRRDLPLAETRAPGTGQRPRQDCGPKVLPPNPRRGAGPL